LIADVSRSEDEMARTAGEFFSAWFTEAEAHLTRVDVGDYVEGAEPTEP
jgi:hypothetical protein